jgi:SET domain-containing protein
MTVIQITPSLGYIKHTNTAKGRGVFASRLIRSGELIEACPVIWLSEKPAGLPANIKTVAFNWSRLADMPGVSAVALGYGSMYNHDNPANARYGASDDGECLVISAVRDIAQDEEITINYNAAMGDPTSTVDCWFERAGITPFSS